MSGTRLVGAGRLCVEVPAEWPFTEWPEIDRSSVLLQQTTAVAAVLRLPPHRTPSGVVMVQMTGESRRTSNRQVARPWRRAEVAGHDAAVCWSPLEDDRWSFGAIVWDLHASVHLEGPRDRCEELVATLAPVADGMVAVPNVWLDHHEQGFGSAEGQPRDEAYLRTLLARDGLDAVFVGPPLHDGRGVPSTHVVGCDPYPTSVVPVGSTVTVTVETWADD